MTELKEPIHRGFYKFGYEEAFTKIGEYFDQYKIKIANKKTGEIIIEASYLYTAIMWSTWIKHIVIKINQRGENITEVDIYGKPALSPLHLFKVPYYRKIKIDITGFKEDFKRAFQKYDWRKN
jgi:hypothetical protein